MHQLALGPGIEFQSSRYRTYLHFKIRSYGSEYYVGRGINWRQWEFGLHIFCSAHLTNLHMGNKIVRESGTYAERDTTTNTTQMHPYSSSCPLHGNRFPLPALPCREPPAPPLRVAYTARLTWLPAPLLRMILSCPLCSAKFVVPLTLPLEASSSHPKELYALIRRATTILRKKDGHARPE